MNYINCRNAYSRLSMSLSKPIRNCSYTFAIHSPTSAFFSRAFKNGLLILTRNVKHCLLESTRWSIFAHLLISLIVFFSEYTLFIHGVIPIIKFLQFGSPIHTSLLRIFATNSAATSRISPVCVYILTPLSTFFSTFIISYWDPLSRFWFETTLKGPL